MWLPFHCLVGLSFLGCVVKRVLVVLLAFTFVVAAPVGAQAVEAAPVQSTMPDFTPSSNKWREYMLNVTSKFLGAVSGGKAGLTGSWKAEHIANQYRYDHGVDALHRATGIPQYIRNANGQLVPFEYEGSYDQAVIDKIDADNKKRGKQLKVPLTKAEKFKKIVGGAGGALTGGFVVPIIGQVGSDILGGWMGYDDVNGEWCSATAGMNEWNEVVFTSVFGFLSGRDCSMFGFDEAYVPNVDQPAEYEDLNFGGVWISYSHAITFQGGTMHCFYSSGVIPPGMGLDTSGGLSTPGQGVPRERASWAAAHNACFGSGNALETGRVNRQHPAEFRFVSWPGMVPVEGGQMVLGEADDPERVLECVITLEDGSTVRAEGQPYRESEGAVAPPACPEVPPNSTPTNVSIGEVGGETVYDEMVDTDVADWWETYPECREGHCKLDLKKKSSGVIGASCFDLADGCAGWFEDPQKTSNYQCTYGVHDVALEECNVYAGLFEPQRTEVGAPYSDPMTGEWSGGQNAPAKDRQAMGQRIQDPTAMRSCDGLNVTGFDPVGFVMRPIQCALEWAFVPRPLVMEVELESAKDAWDGKPPTAIAAALPNMVPAPSASGCSRSITVFSGEFESQLTPINVCPGSWAAPLADFSKIATSVIFTVLVIIVLRRQISGMIGYNQGQ